MFSLFLVPPEIQAHSRKPDAELPPVAQNLVRQGTFAVRLLTSLGMGKSGDEPAAERRLGESGIAPRNGWVADYPVTPDIVGELRKSVTTAVGAGGVKLERDDALKRFADVAAGFDLSVDAEPDGGTGTAYGQHPEQNSIVAFFATVGPPVVTYYEPPPDYEHLYCLVPYTFRSRGASFHGFFILKQFHRTIFESGSVKFVTNSFHVFKSHRVFRIDPVARFSGKTYAGIGAPGGARFIDTGIPGSEGKVFNGHQPWFRPDPGAAARGVERYLNP
jgi:hypothetical protein